MGQFIEYLLSFRCRCGTAACCCHPDYFNDKSWLWQECRQIAQKEILPVGMFRAETKEICQEPLANFPWGHWYMECFLWRKAERLGSSPSTKPIPTSTTSCPLLLSALWSRNSPEHIFPHPFERGSKLENCSKLCFPLQWLPGSSWFSKLPSYFL